MSDVVNKLKDVDEVLDFVIDWTAELDADGVTIATSTYTAEAGITIDSDNIVTGDKKTQVFLSGGTEGNFYTVTNEITTTSPSRTLRKAFVVQVISKPQNYEGYTTVDRVATELDVTGELDRDMIGRKIQEASRFIDNFCGRKFTKQTHVEKFAGNNKQFFLLSYNPVDSITSIVRDGSSITDFEMYDAPSGLMFREDGWERDLTKRYTITYIAGYSLPGEDDRDLPYDIEQACIYLAKVSYQNRLNSTVKTEEVPDVYKVTYGGADEGFGAVNSTQVAKLLAPYKNHRLL